MISIFKPAIKLMNSMRFVKKFRVIFFIFLLPLIISMMYMIFQLDKNVRGKEKQSIGFEYNIAVRSMIQHTQEHRGLTNTYLNGGTDFKDKILQKEKDIEKDISIIQELDNKNGDILKSTQEWDVIKNKLIDLEGTLDKITAKEAIRLHTELIAEMLIFTEKISDNSGLILQEKIDRYYIVDTITTKLPRIAESMGQCRAVGSGVASKKSITEEEKNKLQNLVQSIEIATKDTDRQMQVAFENNSQYKDNIGESYDKAVTSSKNLTNMVRAKLIETDSITLDSKEYFDFTTNSINDIYNMLNSVSNDLKIRAEIDMGKIIVQKNVIISFTIVNLLLVIYLFIGFYFGIKNTIASIEIVSSKIAKGDLSQRVNLNVKDETKDIMESLNKVADVFSNMVSSSRILTESVHGATGTLYKITEQTAEATQSITQAISDLSNGSQTQLSNTIDITNVMNNVADGVQEIAQSSSDVADSSKEMEEEAEKGNISINQLINRMKGMQDYVEESSDIINFLGEKSKNIGQIIGTIEAISYQINLLSLNASIEAARAGEHGKGFSVVAEEVKKLAEQSKESTNQISTLIKDMQQDTLNSVSRMVKINTDVRAGVEDVKATGFIFERILKATKNVSNQIQEVSAVSEEISASAEEITASLSEVSSIAKHNTDTSQNIAGASQEQLASIEEISGFVSSLNVKTKELEALISEFR